MTRNLIRLRKEFWVQITVKSPMDHTVTLRRNTYNNVFLSECKKMYYLGRVGFIVKTREVNLPIYVGMWRNSNLYNIFFLLFCHVSRIKSNLQVRIYQTNC